jgi:DNA-binding CsgD family transcriptional regulator
VTALTASDAEQILRFVAGAESAGGDQVLSPDLLVELGKLIDADWVSYCELDRVRKKDLFYACRPGEETHEGDPDLYWAFVNAEHPICAAEEAGVVDALKISDFMSLRELRASRLYALWFSRFGMERELSVAIPSPLWHTKVLIFNRGPGKDFTERDRAVLDHLRPHLAHMWQAVRTRRLLNAALAEVGSVDEHDARGVIFLGAGREVEFMSPPVGRLLREFFPPAPRGHLPAMLVDWLDSSVAKSLIRRRGGRRLVVEHTGDSLVLQEELEEVQLTVREREVLAWVARGKTNAEVAELLWLAPSTVRKHLENVYAKLDVNTRTAAVARFFGLSEAS